jgi:hypothetical protein
MNFVKRLLNAFKRDPDAWVPIATNLDKTSALVVFYAPNGKYIWGCGADYITIRAEYQDVTHYKIISEAP